MLSSSWFDRPFVVSCLTVWGRCWWCWVAWCWSWIAWLGWCWCVLNALARNWSDGWCARKQQVGWARDGWRWAWVCVALSWSRSNCSVAWLGSVNWWSVRWSGSVWRRWWWSVRRWSCELVVVLLHLSCRFDDAEASEGDESQEHFHCYDLLLLNCLHSKWSKDTEWFDRRTMELNRIIFVQSAVQSV